MRNRYRLIRSGSRVVLGLPDGWLPACVLAYSCGRFELTVGCSGRRVWIYDSAVTGVEVQW